MSTIKSSTTLTTAYSVEADTTGALVIQTGATPTTAVTVSSAQVVTLANALPVDSGGTGATSASAARTSLGLVIGTDVLAPSGSGASLTSLNATNISSGTLAKARLPTGSVLQVVSTTKTDTFSTATTGSWVDVTGLSVSITPTSASSKVYVVVDVALALSTVVDIVQQRLVRNSTAINVGDVSGSRNQVSGASGVISSNNTNANHTRAFNFLDSPTTTSSTTYKIQVFSSTGTKYVNRNGENLDNSTFYTGTSTITVMEIAA